MDPSRLAGVITLDLRGRGPQRGYLFDPHRLALPCWALAAEGTPCVLVTLDRHFDLVPPAKPPRPGLSVAELDAHARLELDVRNYDHVLAAMEAGVISDALVIARTRPVGAHSGDYTDSRGGQHRIVSAATVDQLSLEFASVRASGAARAAREVLGAAHRVVLDVDLDCFTTPSDADPTALVPWTETLIREHLLPRDSQAFWSAVLERCVVLTFAREPHHCGGVIEGNRLFETAARVVFQELLQTDLP